MDSFHNLYTTHKDNVEPLDKMSKNDTVDYIKAHINIHNDIYILIRLYQKSVKDENVYDIKELKNGNIKINIDKLPIPLQHILHDYIKLNKHKTLQKH